MGLNEAKKYIRELHKRQEDPYLWPDFLTGLPDKAAIIQKVNEVFSKLGKYAIGYVRIANIQPYLIKYGPDRHADIIQWAAAILKSNCEECFVGTLSTHDFIIICEASKIQTNFTRANRFFNKRIEKYYSDEDLKNRTTLSFMRNGERVQFGLMRLISVIVDRKTAWEQRELIKEMAELCGILEKSSNDMLVKREEEATAGKKTRKIVPA